ncbi:hypothetical protein ACTHOQ_03130, partial [Solibacillus silvestris]
MKKSFITFCAIALLATQAPAANAAANTEGDYSKVRNINTYKVEQAHNYKIVLNKYIINWNPVYKFVAFKKIESEKTIKDKEANVPVIEEKPEQPKAPAAEQKPEQPKAPAAEEKPEQPKAPEAEQKPEQPKAPAAEEKPEQPKAPEA